MEIFDLNCCSLKSSNFKVVFSIICRLLSYLDVRNNLTLVFQQTVGGTTGHEAESGINKNSEDGEHSGQDDSGFYNLDGSTPSIPPSAAHSYLSIEPDGCPADGMNKSIGGSTVDSVSQMNEQRMGQFTSNSHPRTDFLHQRLLAQPGGDPRAGPSQ